jgi:ribosomal protein S12 methylthiotransferase accessory factor
MRMEISFPGGLEVAARFQGFTIPTDQPEKSGGGGSAPSPFDLFLASIGTCAGLFALRFCQLRDLDTTGLAVTMSGERAEDQGLLSIIRLEIQAPAGFPDKYRGAIVRAVDQCTVKRHLLRPPAFEVSVVESTATPR